MSSKKNARQRGRRQRAKKHEIKSEQSSTFDNTTSESVYQVIFNRDVNWFRFGSVWQLEDCLILHSNYLNTKQGFLHVTAMLKDGEIVEAIEENEDEWRLHYGRLRYRGMVRREDIHYLDVDQQALLSALGAV